MPDRSEPLYLSYLEVLDDEYWALLQKTDEQPGTLRRTYHAARLAYRDAVDRGEDVADAQRVLEQAEALFRADLLARLHAGRRSAICFSGGGIRSATFGLGLLQGLATRSNESPERARPALLGELDFLSTVSGGGYLGGWFSAWATRIAKPTARLKEPLPDRADGPADVIRQLARHPNTAFDPEPGPIRHLRAYSNYLVPRLGLFSSDTWALVATVLRNIFLNWLVLLPLLAGVLLVPVAALDMVRATDIRDGARWFLVITGFLCGAFATGYIGFDLPSAGNARKRYVWYVWCGLVPLILAAIHLTTFWIWLDQGHDAAWFDLVALGRQHLTPWHFAAFGAAMHGGGMLAGILWAMWHYRRPAPFVGLIATVAAVGTGAIAGWVTYLLVRLSPESVAGTGGIIYTCTAFPVLMSVFMFAATLLIGLTSYVTEDQDREWWARSGGLLLSISGSWLAFSAIVLFAPRVFPWLNAQVSAALAAATGWAAAKAGSSAHTPSGRREDGGFGTLTLVDRLKTSAPMLLPPLFLFLLAVLLALLNAALRPVLFPRSLDVASLTPDVVRPMVAATAPTLWLGLLYALLCLGASLFINVNKFSLHSMYRERLIRAYLGASNDDRHPHPFTGFDENDNISMCALTAYRPMHIVNMALNLVGGSNLAWQQRKAESFTSSRLHTGSCRIGYRLSAEYGGRYRQAKGLTPISLGTAVTISGAAASPNMGYNSSPLLTVIMALFNARLGWWLGNPRKGGNTWKYPGPRFGIRPFVDEVLGLTNDTNSWIYLSDGGHFDNLGLYEMVLRRCRYIIVSDAGADPDFTYEDLGNAVRKVRVDLGVSIEFTRQPSMTARQDAGTSGAGHHCAVATIRYSEVDGTAPEENGTLIYIKPSLSGDEPADVLNYASQDPRFPHQPTPDQFFDEAQFESYRRLGMHIANRICDAHGPGTLDVRQFVAAAEKYAASATP